MQHKIKKDFANTPPELAEVFEEQKAALLEEAENHQFKGYRVVKDRLLQLANYKCLYCDKPVVVDDDKKIKATASIEHYRPKGCGYWWLGYEWTNLYLLCKGCNERKRGTFPIAGTKVKAPVVKKKGVPKYFDLSHRFRIDCPELLAEKPLYLNPELVENADFYYCVQNNGKIHIRQNLDTYQHNCAQRTLEILQPTDNSTADDINNRKTIIEDWEIAFIQSLEKIAKGEQSDDLEDNLKKLFLESEDSSLSFTMTRRQVWTEIDRMLLTPIKAISTHYAELFQTALLAFIKNTL
mgnify:CR=1 FL=1